MRLRMELFVQDMDASIAFYTTMLGFELTRRSEDYASLRRGTVIIGLGPIEKLRSSGPAVGVGVEIVLELDDVPALVAVHEHCRAAGIVVEALQPRPWGLQDFRVSDPDGYYLRITHGNAAAQ